MDAADAEEANDAERQLSNDNDDVDSRRLVPKKKMQKKEMHNWIWEDIWAVGLEKMKKTDVIAVRGEKARVRKLRNLLREATMNTISNRESQVNEDKMGLELEVNPGFRRRMQKWPNNIL